MKKKLFYSIAFSCVFLVVHAKVRKKEQLLIENKEHEIKKIPVTITHNQKKNPRTVTFDTNITESMITYTSHWYKPSPSTFYISVNDQEFMTLNKKGKLEVQQTTFALTPKNTIKARYEWTFDKFGKRWHTEEREVEFSIPDNLEKVAMNFGWAQEYRLSISQAQLVAWKNVKPPQTTQ